MQIHYSHRSATPTIKLTKREAKTLLDAQALADKFTAVTGSGCCQQCGSDAYEAIGELCRIAGVLPELPTTNGAVPVRPMPGCDEHTF